MNETRQDWSDLSLVLVGAAGGLSAKSEVGLLTALVTMEPALRRLGGMRGVRAKQKALAEAAEAVRSVPSGWTEDRKAAVRAELLDAYRVYAAWAGTVAGVLEALEKLGWRYREKDGNVVKERQRGEPGAPMKAYDWLIVTLYCEMWPAYAKETGNLKDNPQGLRRRISARLAMLPFEYRDPDDHKPMWQAIQNSLKKR